MIKYNPKNWFSLIFQFHKSDTFRILLPTMVLMGIYTAIIIYVDDQFFEITHQNTTSLHSLLAFVMSMILIFRTNSAYDRWWEGRKAWGNVTNNSRGLAIKLSAFLVESKSERVKFSGLISNFVESLKGHLRNQPVVNNLKPIDGIIFSQINYVKHLPNYMASILMLEINNLYKQNKISGEQLITLEKDISVYLDSLGACERIKNTPIPYSYSIFMKKFIFLYVMTLPFGFIPTFAYWTIPIVMFVFYVLVSIELLAEEIENPFGMDANDLPIEEMTENIKQNVEEILF